MDIAIGQFAAASSWKENLVTCARLMDEAAARGAQLLILPEGVHARFASPPTAGEYLDADQPVGGPFVDGILEASTRHHVATIVGVKGTVDGRRRNTLVVARDGQLVATYDKLHVMDAFGGRESDVIHASDDGVVTFDLDGHCIGLMTCYDLRFPELARLLAIAGAELIALPAAWVAGPQKERHWQVLVAARALENTVYIAGSGESGPRNIGCSMFVDPMGVVLGQLGHEEGLLSGRVNLDYLAQVRRDLPVLQNRRFDVSPTVRPNPRNYATDPMPTLDDVIDRESSHRRAGATHQERMTQPAGTTTGSGPTS